MTAVVPVGKARLDEAVVARGLANTRSRARALILAGDVQVNGATVVRAGAPVRPADAVELAARPRFVSRGGDKLAHALDRFRIVPIGLVAADFGASTGGFTDCLLQGGVSRVYAVDVGYGQLDARLRQDPRVTVMERLNARYLDRLPEPVDLVVIDVSFISLGVIFPVAAKVLISGGRCVPLIKPQFEAGRRDVGKGGVVKDAAIHRQVLETVLAAATENGFSIQGLTASPLRGPAGNVEFLAALTLDREPTDAAPLIAAALAEAAELAT
ncbi:MAG: RNA binding methyltransferase FtsJ like [uncultured Thermomicrobiales bacterium]|uniref:RNA binding methyltransferase FtsJ like n=1 Tax=uncultured Thermomicrobiales bacterium TaxID=1645740 RepID=A0A6J4TM54_9BACT|nr:MAG: RNA binding methyltransferase FtsJ like [uncultured Thermomicrobiales bacterium]